MAISPTNMIAILQVYCYRKVNNIVCIDKDKNRTIGKAAEKGGWDGGKNTCGRLARGRPSQSITHQATPPASSQRLVHILYPVPAVATRPAPVFICSVFPGWKPWPGMVVLMPHSATFHLPLNQPVTAATAVRAEAFA
jgi:hypothetical protein